MSSLVKCKACDNDIAKGVKKCPQCGKDQRNWFMRHKIMTFLGALLVLIIISSLGGGNGTDTDETAVANEQTKANDEKKEEFIYSVGDTINIKQLDITLTQVEELTQIGDPQFLGKKAPEGSVLVAVQYTMKNVSDKPVGMFSYPTVNLVDGNETKYSSDFDGSVAYSVETGIDDSKAVSDLNPDISVTKVEVYEVSETRFAEGDWYIQLGKEKIKVK
ncbi:hypothetical protein CSV77_14805 [Sporosarcina sp. P16b]|uniref:DUF4352 domain-containing protein n=1 Tax=Sporosarcina sp. P16b TaxID=2048261 RepID=UPI000C169C38|nr:DUF4352 domain-containing protein [Sporosarcina sp. P16b]PIC69204.1 hypothetical protein CSV77_14805 [Sporosarcina sp. P16b]